MKQAIKLLKIIAPAEGIMRKSFFPSILLISLMALNLAFLSCGGNDSDTKLKGIFDGIGPWSGSATATNGDTLDMAFADNNEFTLDIVDKITGDKWKVKGTFVTKDGKLSLEPTGYYDPSNPNVLVNFKDASQTDKQAIEKKLKDIFGGDYTNIGYSDNGNNIAFSDENGSELIKFPDITKGNPPNDPVNPNDPIYEDDDEGIINLTEWLNDPANKWTVGKPGKKTAYEYTGTDTLKVPSNTVLKILPATTITFTQLGGGLVVQSGGGIEAEGTASGHIVFKGGITKGSWSSIAIQSNYDNKLDYVEIINAGRSSSYPPISITTGNSVSITNSIIDGSTTNGISIPNATGVLTEFDNNTIKNCNSEPIHSDYLWPLRNIGKNNIYDTNTPNRINIGAFGSSYARIPDSNNMTIKNIGIPYYFSEGLIHDVSDSTITIEAGVEILVNKNCRISIRSGSHLVAKGTDQEPITFKPVDSAAQKGYWDGIAFNTPGNELDYVEIINAGRNSSYPPISIAAGNSVSITNSIIDGSLTNGISIAGYGSESVLTAFDNNIIKNCDSEPIHSEYLWSLRNISKNNIYDTTNTLNRINIGAFGSSYSRIPDSTDMTIKNIGIPYYFSEGLRHDAQDSTITIEAGVEILVNNNCQIIIASASHLVAIGTPSDRIKIQGLSDVQGWWRGVEISSNTQGTKFAYCDISGGGGGTNYACLVINTNDYAQLKGVKLSKSSTYGLKLNGSSSTNIAKICAEDVTFEDNLLDNVWEYVHANSFTTYSVLSDFDGFTPTDPL